MRKNGMNKVKKTYLVEFYVDTHIDGKPHRANGIYMGEFCSVSECLHELLNKTSESISEMYNVEDMYFCIGIHSIQTRPDAYVNHSYINRTIWNDEVLNDWFYC